ncbi:unnamed protein product, partial [Iphiclides podalirius]
MMTDDIRRLLACLDSCDRVRGGRGSAPGKAPRRRPAASSLTGGTFPRERRGAHAPAAVGMFFAASKAGAAPRLASWCGVFAWRARPPHPARKRRDAPLFHQEVSRGPPAPQGGTHFRGRALNT